MQRCTELVDSDYATLDVLRVLDSVSANLAAMTGQQTDRMTRDDGWRLLSIGRQVERLDFLSMVLARAFESGIVAESAGFEAQEDAGAREAEARGEPVDGAGVDVVAPPPLTEPGQ